MQGGEAAPNDYIPGMSSNESQQHCPNAITDYRLIDSGDGQKLERFGEVLVSRPCGQAVWRQSLSRSVWAGADAVFSRDGSGGWSFNRELPEPWLVTIEGLVFKLVPTDFGHLGVFPEHRRCWRTVTEIVSRVSRSDKNLSILNLFAYSGGASLAACRAGGEVCHLDASKKMVAWARENAAFNDMTEARIRWIVDDVQKFLKREIRRGRTYDAVILDPPSYGRGRHQELFKIDDHMIQLLDMCRQVLCAGPAFVFLSCHTPGYTPLVLEHLLSQAMAGQGGSIDSGEMILEGRENGVLPLPSGTFAVWRQ